MSKNLLNAFMLGCVLGVLGFMLTGCGASLVIKPTQNQLDEPILLDSVTKIGHSYECDTRTATIENPLEQAIYGLVDCGCGDETVRVPPRSDVTLSLKSHKSLSHRNACSFGWSIPGQGMPVITSKVSPVPNL